MGTGERPGAVTSRCQLVTSSTSGIGDPDRRALFGTDCAKLSFRTLLPHFYRRRVSRSAPIEKQSEDAVHSAVQRLARNPNCGAFHVYNRVHDKYQDMRGRITAHLRQRSRSCCRSCLPATTPPRRPVRSRPSPRAGRGG